MAANDKNCIFKVNFKMKIIYISFIPGPDTCEGKRKFRTRRSQCIDTPKNDTRMGKVLQTVVWWFCPSFMDRCNIMFYSLLNPSQYSRGACRRQCKYHLNSFHLSSLNFLHFLLFFLPQLAMKL